MNLTQISKKWKTFVTKSLWCGYHFISTEKRDKQMSNLYHDLKRNARLWIIRDSCWKELNYYPVSDIEWCFKLYIYVYWTKNGDCGFCMAKDIHLVQKHNSHSNGIEILSISNLMRSRKDFYWIGFWGGQRQWCSSRSMIRINPHQKWKQLLRGSFSLESVHQRYVYPHLVVYQVWGSPVSLRTFACF